ncbi:Protein OSCP1, partial [Varanus komodoensis]
MSLRTLPLLVLNLGGEMLYIVDQRLRAQSIPGDKARQAYWFVCSSYLTHHFFCFMLHVDAWTDVDRRR